MFDHYNFKNVASNYHRIMSYLQNGELYYKHFFSSDGSAIGKYVKRIEILTKMQCALNGSHAVNTYC